MNKKFSWILLVLLAASPAWAAKKITVAQLKELLSSMSQAKKTDAEIGDALQQVELTEELDRATMNSLAQYISGREGTVQLYVLEARSAVLPPPAADLPATPAPDAAAQAALLSKAADYAAKTYAQLPKLSATKTTIRFQDNVSAMAAASGMTGGAVGSAADDPNLVRANLFVHFINSSEANVSLHNGIEDNPLVKDKTKWGANGYIALLGQGPVLSNVIQEAQAANKISFLRWENINGKPTAVFTYSVDKKKSHYQVNYCCFPDAGTVGDSHMGTNASASMTMQTHIDYTQYYKNVIPYHGEIFVDPDTGIVVRLITQGEFKTSDYVHQEDQRIDYAPVPVDGKSLVLPVKSVINTEVVPNGDTGSGKFVLRHTLFTSEYKGYQPAL